MSNEEQFAAAMAAARLKLLKFNASKKRPISLDGEPGLISVEAFGKKLRDRIGTDVKIHVDIFTLSMTSSEFEEVIVEYAKNEGIYFSNDVKEKIVPESLSEYTLNCDMASDPIKFFVTKDEVVSKMSGAFYLAATGMKYDEAIGAARHVHRIYDPRGEPGLRQVQGRAEVLNAFNTYVPPTWMKHANFTGNKNPVMPTLFKKLIQHVFPVKTERSYFYAWLYMSLFERAPTYLVLNGDPGIGKNRLKLLMRALHGHENTPDGKKSMLTERFNSQVENTTLLWFDELKYNDEIENIMKEMQNETLSIERKGVDATRSTKIFASMVIANNYPRDNYIQFDSRKFAPLQLTTKRLETTMSNAEIDKLTRMTQFEESADFDVGAIASFAKWIKRYGPGFAKKYKNMEYKGPRFWFLAHTSMSKWQMGIVQFFYGDKKGQFAPDLPHENGYLWSAIEPLIRRKMGRGYNHWPHVENVRRFLEIYCGLDGRKGFQTTLIGDLDGDFYVKPLIKRVMKPSEEDKEYLDL